MILTLGKLSEDI